MANKQKKEITIRSSAAEYLTFITASGENDVNAIYSDENVWLTQKMMGVLYGVGTNTINYHLKKLFADGEIQEDSTIRIFRIVQSEDGREVAREVKHYNLAAIIAVGNKVDSPRAVQFRKWANAVIEEYTIKGFAMDDERLKNDGSILTKKYFEEQLQRVREIRMSERKFYQKITDIYATSIDYDPEAFTTRQFFAKVQNKLHWAIHGETAAETIYHRADADKEHMGLTTWKDAPSGKIQQFDVTVAKNYLTREELEQMSRIVSGYLDLAESMALREIPMTMEDWASRFDVVLQLTGREVLDHAGAISAAVAKEHALTQFEIYRIRQDRFFRSDFDAFLEAKALPPDCPDAGLALFDETQDGEGVDA